MADCPPSVKFIACWLVFISSDSSLTSERTTKVVPLLVNRKTSAWPIPCLSSGLQPIRSLTRVSLTGVQRSQVGNWPGCGAIRIGYLQVGSLWCWPPENCRTSGSLTSRSHSVTSKQDSGQMTSIVGFRSGYHRVESSHRRLHPRSLVRFRKSFATSFQWYKK